MRRLLLPLLAMLATAGAHAAAAQDNGVNSLPCAPTADMLHSLASFWRVERRTSEGRRETQVLSRISSPVLGTTPLSAILVTVAGGALEIRYILPPVPIAAAAHVFGPSCTAAALCLLNLAGGPGSLARATLRLESGGAQLVCAYRRQR